MPTRITPHLFKHPRAISTPGYFWVMNAPMEEELLYSQLEEFKACGIQTVCLHPSPRNWSPFSEMSPDYLTKEYLEVLRKIVQKCHELDICFYLYDEGGYPSGSAAGIVVNSNPEKFAMQGVRLSADGKSAEFQKDTEITDCSYPNLLTKGVTEKFIEVTHEQFKKYFGEYFGKNIFYSFMDEPRCPRFGMDHELSWCDDFAEEFEKRKGYSILPFLKEVIQVKDKESRLRQQHRVDYYDVCSQLFVERFFKPIQQWCRNNGIMSSGHLSGENSTNGNIDFAFIHILRDLRALDCPGVDVIWRQLYPRTKPATRNIRAVPRKLDPIFTGQRSHPFTKYASSVAHQKGTPDVMTETFAVYGDGLQPGIMRCVTDYQLVRGANRFVLSNIPMVIHGNSLLGCQPYFGTSNPLWKYFDIYHHYTARMSELLAAGTPDIHVAFYHDVQGVWCGGKTMEETVRQHDTTAEALLQRQVDFDFIDDDVLSEARLVGKALRIGKMCYDTIVIPHTEWMSEKSRKRLLALQRAGGSVLFPEQIDQIAPTLQVSPANSEIRVQKRQMGKGSVLYFIASESPDELKLELTIPENGSWQCYNAEEGVIEEIPHGDEHILKWTFAPYHSLALMVNSPYKADRIHQEFQCNASRKISSGWTLQRWISYDVGEEEYQIDHTPGKIVSCKLGDWRSYLGEDFSGEAVYRTTFRGMQGKKFRLNLGKVGYACTVYLNGKCLGRKFWGPYIFPIPTHLLKKENHLEVRVTNTYANAMSSKKMQKVLDRYYGGSDANVPYREVTKLFDRDSLASGLFGPVKLEASL